MQLIAVHIHALSNATDYEGSGIFLDDASDDGDSDDSDKDNTPAPKKNIEAKLGEDLFKTVSGRMGGEKLQKIVVGRWLSFQNKVIILPYEGLAEVFYKEIEGIESYIVDSTYCSHTL